MSYWTDEKLCKLVQLYSKRNNLWDRNHRCYDNLRSRYTSYSKILRSLSMPICVSVSDVICKLKELRNIYVSELKKIEVASRAGCIYRPNHSWFEIMNEFLYDNLDADERLTEFSSSEDGKVGSSEDILRVCQPQSSCSHSNTAYDSDSNSDGSFDSRNKSSFRKICKRFTKRPKKSQAYFIRSPTVLKSTKMNTKYEFPRKMRSPLLMPVKNHPSRRGSTTFRRTEDTQQCTRLDVKMTSSDVSIKYLKTESVNGDEKCYKKNLKGPRCSTSKPSCFKNIKMVISKSGYAAPKSARKYDEKEDEDTEFWEMMSMLDLGVPCPLTKLETTQSPKTSCCSIISSNSQVFKSHQLPSRKSSATCCTPSCKDFGDEKRVDRIMRVVDAPKRKSKTSREPFASRQSCCSKGKVFAECEDMQKREESTTIEPCGKGMKVMCLGDGTLFDNNLLEILQDLSIKICPIDGQCASGNCSSVKQSDDVFEDILSCRTCSSSTRPIKEYDTDSQGTVGPNDADSSSANHDPSITEENINEHKTSSETDDATTSKEESADPQDGLESASRPGNDLGVSIPKTDTDRGTEGADSSPLNTEQQKKVGLSVPPSRRNYDVNVLLEPADGRSSSKKEAIIHEAKKELLEAGKLYNGGKYITHEGTSPVDSKNEEFSEFDNFGAQIASSLKMMGTQRAMKLKLMISETLQGGRRKKFL